MMRKEKPMILKEYKLVKDSLPKVNKPKNEEEKNIDQTDNSKYNHTYIFHLTGVVVSLIGLYYIRKLLILEEKEQQTPDMQEQAVTLYRNLINELNTLVP